MKPDSRIMTGVYIDMCSMHTFTAGEQVKFSFLNHHLTKVGTLCLPIKAIQDSGKSVTLFFDCPWLESTSTSTNFKVLSITGPYTSYTAKCQFADGSIEQVKVKIDIRI